MFVGLKAHLDIQLPSLTLAQCVGIGQGHVANLVQGLVRLQCTGQYCASLALTAAASELTSDAFEITSRKKMSLFW